MLHKLALTLSFLLACFLSNAKDEFAFGKIDTSLLRNADAVIRNYEMRVRVISKSSVDIKEHFVITVLNERGAKFANFSKGYSSLSKIEDISGRIYDKDGKEIKRLWDFDFTSRQAVMAYGFYDDNRVKEYKFNSKQYPYTIEYNVTTHQNNSFELPEFIPQENNYCSVENAVLTVIAPIDIEIQHKSIGFYDTLSKIERNNKVCIWQVSNLHAYEPEPLSLKNECNNGVFLSCRDFSLEEFNGNQSTWKDFGQFVFALNKGRDILPSEIKEKVKSITFRAVSKLDSIKLLYEFLQNNTRYVAIEYGISGWQTFDAKFVAKNQYGDCKALTNYMMTLLKEAGIESYPVLVMAGKSEFDKLFPDFPYHQFNHVILSVPLNKDTLWLECTSDELPVNFLSSFTEDRYGLMITPDGGKLVHTPKYDTTSNVVIRKALASLDADKLTAVIDNIYRDEPAVEVYQKTTNESENAISQYVNNKFHIASYSASSFNYKREDTGTAMIMDEKVDLAANSMLSHAEDFKVLNYDILPLDLPVYPILENRKTAFCISQALKICDSFVIDIPKDDKVVSVPEATVLQNSFGRYTSTVKLSGNKIVVSRQFVQNKGVYEPSLYNKYVAWLAAVNKDKAKRILLKSI